MRIAVLVSEFPALSETFVLNQITGLIDRGHSVTIIADHARDEKLAHSEIDEYRLLERTHYFSLPRWDGNKLMRSLRLGRALYSRYLSEPSAVFDYINILSQDRDKAAGRLLARASYRGPRDFDVLLCHFGPNGNRALLLREAGAVSGKIATIFHGYDVTQMVNAEAGGFYDGLFGEGDLFLPVSQFFAKRLVELGAPRDRLVTHHMGIDARKFPFAPRRLDSNEIRIVSVGRLVEKKGFEFGIRALAQARQAGEKLHYTIIGDGPEREKLEALIDKLSLRGIVTLYGAGSRGEIMSALLESHLFLAPSVTAADGDMEGIPVVITEAMATGLPVIGTAHGGIPEIIDDEISGYLVPERDPAALARAIWKAIDWRAAWPQIAHAARKIVERDFNIDALNDALVARFEHLLRTHGEIRRAA